MMKLTFWTTETFIEKSNKIHNNVYDYSKCIYNGYENKCEIICKTHGSFWQKAGSHLNGCGCNKCFGSIKKNITQFITEASKKHNNFYNYDLFEYKGAHIKGIIICPNHGQFMQNPHNHLNGNGCPTCAGNKLSNKEDFINKASIIHKNKYIYNKFVYINRSTKSIIICKDHGEFEQTPKNHLKGQGCPKCTYHISKQEIMWLDLLGIPEEYRHSSIIINNKSYQVDAFDYINKIIYEFYGDYWHGNINKYNPDKFNERAHKTYGELYNNTIKREMIFKNAGYTVISIWENDWKNYANKNI